MNGIEVNKDVVCINNKGAECTGLKQGGIYRVLAIQKQCCGVSIDIGLPEYGYCAGYRICSICGLKTKNDGIEWKDIRRFAPLMDISELESILNTKEQKA